MSEMQAWLPVAASVGFVMLAGLSWTGVVLALVVCGLASTIVSASRHLPTARRYAPMARAAAQMTARAVSRDRSPVELALNGARWTAFNLPIVLMAAWVVVAVMPGVLVLALLHTGVACLVPGKVPAADEPSSRLKEVFVKHSTALVMELIGGTAGPAGPMTFTATRRTTITESAGAPVRAGPPVETGPPVEAGPARAPIAPAGEQRTMLPPSDSDSE